MPLWKKKLDWKMSLWNKINFNDQIQMEINMAAPSKNKVNSRSIFTLPLWNKEMEVKKFFIEHAINFTEKVVCTLTNNTCSKYRDS